MNTTLHYLSTDPGNADRTAALAAQIGHDLEVVEPRDLPRLERLRARLILDYDFLPHDLRTYLLNGTAAIVVAVHGYNLGDGSASFLPRRGIVCSPRLDARFFQALGGDANAA